MNATLTHHGRDRMKERLGLSLGASERLATLALEKGIEHGETAGALRRFIDKQAMTHGGAHYRIYAQSLFIFQEGRLVTVLKLPNALKAAAQKIKQRKAGTR